MKTDTRYNQLAEDRLDRRYTKENGAVARIVLRVFRSHVNKLCKTMLGRAHERGIVDSKTFHELAGMVDHMLWPDRNVK